ncbi:MAG: helix-turn-helix domain-containing protein, partial [Microthrixaceae bacterium]|nr:helix-turn-helix domain-containing protein [Microthrixaceae bacterium]
MERMGTFVGAAEATRILGVRPETLYAYVSRGLIGRRVGPDGRRSLYDRDDIEALARRGRSRTSPPRPSIDVQVASAVTSLDEEGPSYRGRPL